MTPSLILAAVLLAATAATAWGQSTCGDMRQLRPDEMGIF